MRIYLSVILALLLIFGITRDSLADRRSYVWTYEYMTMPKGEWELEAYLTTEIPDLHRSNVNAIKPQLELEYGITDRWDIALYQAWEVQNKIHDDDAEYKGFKLRTRYRIGEKNRFIVDPLVYFEYIRDDDFSQPNEAEVKLVLAKDIGDFNISYNQILERNLESEGKTDHEYAGGISYCLTTRLRAGIESKGNYSKERYALGPTFSYVFSRAFITLGAAFGLNENTDDLQTRMIVGLSF